MKVIFVVATISLCMVHCHPPSDLAPLLSEEVDQDVLEKKLQKVLLFDSEEEAPWLDDHPVELKPLLPKPFPPVALVVGAPKPKPQKDITKKSKKNKKPKRKHSRKPKNPKKQTANELDAEGIEDRFGLYAAAAYPSFQGHRVIPVLYPDVPSSHLHIKPYLSESSEEYEKRRVKKKSRQNRHRNRNAVEKQSASDSSEFDRVKQMSRKDRRPKNSITSADLDKHQRKHHKYIDGDSASSSDEHRKRNKNNKNKSNPSQEALEEQEGDSKSDESNNVRSIKKYKSKHQNRQKIRKNSKKNTKNAYKNKTKTKNSLESDETVTSNLESEQSSSQSRETQNSMKREKTIQNEDESNNVSEETVTSHKRFEHEPNVLKQSIVRSKERDTQNSVKNNKSITSLKHNKNNSKIIKPLIKKISSIENIPDNSILNDGSIESKEIVSNPLSDENHSDHSKLLVNNESNQLDLLPDSNKDIILKKEDYQNDLIDSRFNDIILEKDSSFNNAQITNDLELSPIWFPNPHLDLFDTFLNSEEKLQTEYNQNLENLLLHPLNESVSEEVNEEIKKLSEFDDENKSSDEKSKRQIFGDQKPESSDLNENSTAEDWLIKINEIINLLRDDKYGKITEDLNSDGIFVTKHNPQTGKQDESQNSIFITKVVHALDDTKENLNKPDLKHIPKQMEHIYEISNHPKYTTKSHLSKENIKIEDPSSDNKLSSIEVKADENSSNLIPIPIEVDPQPNFLFDNKIFYNDLRHQGNLNELLNDYDQYVDDLNLPNLFKLSNNYEEILNTNAKDEDNNLIPLQDLTKNKQFSPKLKKDSNDLNERNHQKTSVEELPFILDDEFVVNGKVEHIYLMDQDNTTNENANTLLPSIESNINIEKLELSLSPEESTLESTLSLEINETNSSLHYNSKAFINTLNKLNFNNSNIDFLQSHIAVEKVNEKDNLNLNKDDKTPTPHIIDKNNDTNKQSSPLNDVNDRHSSTEIIEDVGNAAANLTDIKYIIKDCDATTKKINEANSPHNIFNLSFLFNKK